MAKSTEHVRQRNHRIFNNVLSVVVIALSLYILVLPLLPNLKFKLDKATGSKPALVKANTPGDKTTEQIPSDNTLVVPSINMQQTIYESATISALSKGIWHRPLTSSPDKGGNTVLVGHRYTLAGGGVFYHLDKIHTGDEIFLYWQSKKYRYVVSKVEVVPPTEIKVEAPTSEPILTLYTCAPLYSFTDRLVITAKEVVKP